MYQIKPLHCCRLDLICRIDHEVILLIPRVINYVRWRHFLWFNWLSFDFLYAENVSRFRSYPVRMAHGYLYVYWITIYDVQKCRQNTCESIPNCITAKKSQNIRMLYYNLSYAQKNLVQGKTRLSPKSGLSPKLTIKK